MRLFLLGLLISLNVFASSWENLSADQTFKLNQSFQLRQLGERSGSILDFIRGESYYLREIVPLSLPGANLILYLFDLKRCPGQQMKTDMEIIPVNGTRPLVEIGAQVEECQLHIYLETKDYYSSSLFE